jgi:hypothetical protein
MDDTLTTIIAITAFILVTIICFLVIIRKYSDGEL